jgi:hypothetical protein
VVEILDAMVSILIAIAVFIIHNPIVGLPLFMFFLVIAFYILKLLNVGMDILTAKGMLVLVSIFLIMMILVLTAQFGLVSKLNEFLAGSNSSLAQNNQTDNITITNVTTTTIANTTEGTHKGNLYD